MELWHVQTSEPLGHGGSVGRYSSGPTLITQLAQQVLRVAIDQAAKPCAVLVARSPTRGLVYLAAASRRTGQLAREAAKKAAKKKEDKYKHVAEQMSAVHLPFAVESMGGLSETAQQLIRGVHHSVGSHCTWRDANAVGTHLVDAVAMAVQRCTGMALQTSADREMRVAMGVGAA